MNGAELVFWVEGVQKRNQQKSDAQRRAVEASKKKGKRR